MNSTHNDNVFIYSDNNYATNIYYQIIEEQPYFENVGNFRVHGKYVSNFRPGKNPNEYYCKMDEAMTLRSGKKLNYMQKSSFIYQARDVIVRRNAILGKSKRRCLSCKEMIWFWNSYYHLLSNSYELACMYDVSRNKIKEYIQDLEMSVPGLYQNVKFEKKTSINSKDRYLLNNDVSMPKRDTRGKV